MKLIIELDLDELAGRGTLSVEQVEVAAVLRHLADGITANGLPTEQAIILGPAAQPVGQMVLRGTLNEHETRA